MKKKKQAKRLNSKKYPRSVPYDGYLMDLLKDPEACADYLNANFDEYTDAEFDSFFVALQNVLRARGIGQAAIESGLPRDTIYKTFLNRNPKFNTMTSIL